MCVISKDVLYYVTVSLKEACVYKHEILIVKDRRTVCPICGEDTHWVSQRLQKRQRQGLPTRSTLSLADRVRGQQENSLVLREILTPANASKAKSTASSGAIPKTSQIPSHRRKPRRKTPAEESLKPPVPKPKTVPTRLHLLMQLQLQPQNTHINAQT